MHSQAAPINGRGRTLPRTVTLHVRGHNGVSKAEVSLDDSWVKEIVTQTWNDELGTERVLAYCGNQLHFPMTQRAAVAHVEAEEIENACYQCLQSRVFGECANQGQKSRRDMNARITSEANPLEQQPSLIELDRDQNPEVRLPFRGAATAPNNIKIAAASNVHLLAGKQGVPAEDEDLDWQYDRLVGQGRLN
ncbi:hypothetical protein KEM56_007204 [Ascosphaera pollenicola]|nr:hypothetical protein KEM56_007204 [Ascosphaera pollenicola]